MKIKIEINCDNAAFEPDPEVEVGRILLLLARELHSGGADFREIRGYGPRALRDANGNTVGRLTVSKS